MTRACVRALTLLGFVASAAHAQAPATPAIPPQRFEARADIVLVDVSVVDNRGRPVTDLKPDEFTLEVEGSRRSLQSLRFVATQPAATPRQTGEASTRAREALTTTNTAAAGGRLLLIAVDESYLSVGANRAVLRAAEGLLERLAPGDLVGFARIPGGIGGVEFTTDRALIRTALRSVTGRPTMRRTSYRVYLSEANDLVNGARERWPAAIDRECPRDRTFDSCVALMEGVAQGLISDHEIRTNSTLRFLDGISDRLRTLNTPVNLVLISEGLFAGPSMRANIDRLAARAAASRVSLHVVRPARELYDIDDNGRAPDALQDDRLLREGLEQLAARMRGGLFTASGNASGVFDRISAELSGYYLLGFEPNAEDRSGKVRRIKVEVRRRGVTVRARASFAVPSGARGEGDSALPGSEPPAATGSERLQQALTSPIPTPGLPIRVATYRATSAVDGQVRMIVSAEIGEPTREAASVDLGLLVVDANGKPVVSHLGAEPLEPALADSPSSRLFLSSVVLPPGDYTLRFAASGADGLIGSVHHAFSARLQPAAAGLSVSDVIVSSSTSDGPRPSPSAIVDSDRILLMLEGQHADAATLEGVRVTFDIVDAARGRAVGSVEAQSEARGEGTRRAFAALVPASALSAGEYVVRARVEPPGRPAVTLERPFRFEPSAAPPPAAAAAVAGGAAPPAAAVVSRAPPVAARIALPMLRFTADDALRPEIVNQFLEYLSTSQRPSESVRPILDQARRGTFAQRTAPAGAPVGDDVVLSFIGGLAALRQGQVPQATTLFQRALRGAPEFVGIAFYLGAAHAISGRDREAAGAWQMAMLSPEAEPARPFLVDALLRVGEGQRALDAIQNAPDAWKASPPAKEREALAEGVAGRYADAVPKIASLIAARPKDLDLLYVGVQLLYRQHLQQPLSGDDLKRFDEWSKRYEDAADSKRPSVAPWRSYVLR